MTDINFTIFIPARLGSSRLPRKLLLPLAGKPVIYHTIDRAIEASAKHIVVVADHAEIAEAVNAYKDALPPKISAQISVFMSQQVHESGTDRIAEAVAELKYQDDEIIVNLQADEPLMPKAYIQAAANCLEQTDAPMASLAMPISDTAQVTNPNVVKVVMNQLGQALYFSRSPIPYDRDQIQQQSYCKHLGMYAYRAGFLKKWSTLPNSLLEETEKLEQLRVLDAGYQINMQIVQQMDLIGIDTAEQLKIADEILSKR